MSILARYQAERAQGSKKLAKRVLQLLLKDDGTRAWSVFLHPAINVAVVYLQSTGLAKDLAETWGHFRVYNMAWERTLKDLAIYVNARSGTATDAKSAY